MEQNHLVILATELARHIDRSLMTIARRAGVHARLFERLEEGAGCNIRTFIQTMQWFADNWPEDLEWPRDVPRPTQKKEVA